MKAFKFSFLLLSNEYFHVGQHDLLLLKNQASSMITGIYLGNTAADGIRCYGAIQDAQALSEGVVASSRYPKHWLTVGDPAREFTMTQSAPLMVLPDPDEFVVVQVK